jgi:putative FmdB family regulatory protein
MGIEYEHECRTCGLVWIEEYGLSDPLPFECPECKSNDIYRCVGSAGFQLKGGGVGWHKDGYYGFKAYDTYLKDGLRVQRFESKEELNRVERGEAEAAELRKLKRLNEVAKRTLGPGAAVTEQEAAKKIKKAGNEAITK